jgi:hypothetical protein
MADCEKVRVFNVSKSRGDGVTVKVSEAELKQGVGEQQEVATRAAQTWAELEALATEYNVPHEHWSINPEALKILGPEPGSSD